MVQQAKPSLSFIVPTYQEEAYIEKTLSALTDAMQKTEQQGTKSELIVVDSGTDETFEKARKFTENVHKFSTRGVSKARNFAASKAHNGILVFVDADVIVPAEAVEEISKIFQENDVIAAVSYVLPHKNSKLSASERLFFALDKFFIKRLAKSSNAFLRLYTRGDLIAVRKESFSRIGGFNEKLNCMETTDFLERLLKTGRIAVLDSPVFETGRRISRYGLVRNYLIWYRNYASYLLLKRPYSTTWEPIR